MADQGTYTATNLPVDGTTIDASDVNTDLQGLIDEFNKQVGYSKMNINGNITNSDIIVSAGINLSKLESVAWTAWTPTFVNWTIGTGGSAGTTAFYQKIGRVVNYYLISTLGSSGASVGGDVTFTLPVAAKASLTSGTGVLPIGRARFEDNAITNYAGEVYINSAGTTGTLYVHNSNGSYVSSQALSSTIPFSWAAGDVIFASGTYEAAA
ncbi:MAG: hypothetical protein NUV80_04435 [Candidatus Berkelbacteria bacterium]|nr:hypothetical protein [Candidatus Berkelbacteria bacterium]